MKSKIDIRKQLEAGMSLFVSSGKQITKLPTLGKRRELKPKISTVEIDLDYLPTHLRKKHFGDT